MPNSKPIALLCRISRGGFTDERVFRVQLAENETHVGACPRQYCYTKSWRLLSPEQPENGKTLEGLVAARRIREEEDGSALVSVPDGEVLLVKADQIREAPKELSPDVRGKIVVSSRHQEAVIVEAAAGHGL